MCHTLPATFLSEEELNTAKSPATQAFLNAYHYNRHFPLSATYGPTKMDGLGFRDMIVKHGAQHITLLFKHLRANDGPIAHHFMIAMDWCQKVTGFKH